MRWSGVPMAAVLIVVGLGTLVAALVQDPIRVGPASRFEIIGVSVIILLFALIISFALVIGEEEIE